MMPITSNTSGFVFGFSDMTLQVSQESLLYPASSLFGDIGGSLGLFLGFSLLTFGETIIKVGKVVFDKCNVKKW